MTLALAGTKVLDLSRLAPGPFCTMILADLGAEVLRIDAPDFTSPLPQEVDEERQTAYSALGRNKKSITLNLKTKEARQVFYRLVETADVVIEGFRPGVASRLGVDYETLREITPRIVYCSLSGYGQDGPYRDLVGHDVNYISIAGALSIIGIQGGRPVIPSNLVADFAGGGSQAVIGILVALLVRERTGRGQFIDISMLDGAISLLSSEASQFFATGAVPRREETTLAGAVPFYNVYQAKDGGYISIGCIEPKFWENLCRALGREDFIPHQHTTGEKREEIFSFLRHVFLTKSRDEWFQLLSQTDTCVAPVYDLEEVFSDPHVLHRRMVVEVNHPKVGKVKQVGIPIKLSETPGEVRSTAPLTGEHTEEVLSNLGYTKADIDRLRQEGAIG